MNAKTQPVDNSYSSSQNPGSGGSLRVFFGYMPGVAATPAMLEAARSRQEHGATVVVGYVAQHTSRKTRAACHGLECLAPLDFPYQGHGSGEFDLDTALARKPDLVVLDDLAHTNAPGVRHAKRWQDVEELLAAGIDVFATAYVQHVESLSSTVEQICGVTFRDTFPDHLLDRADEVTLIDLPLDDLREQLDQEILRMNGETAGAFETAYRRDNLIAMRELALRQVADCIHQDVQAARQGSSASKPWPTRERILVCVGASPTSAKVVRAAKRFADPLHAEWIALHVDTGDSANADEHHRRRVIQNLRLAESLGAEVVQLSGHHVATELLLYARQRNATRIVIGKTDERRGTWWRRKSLVDQLVRDSGNIDVMIVRGIDEPPSVDVQPPRKTSSPVAWVGTLAALAAATLVSFAFKALGFSEANLVMLYLLAIVFVGVRFGALHSALASVTAVLLFDVLFTRPYYAVTVHDTEYVITFSVMLGVGLLASSLTSRTRRQAEVARRNERRVESLYRLSRELAAIAGASELVSCAEQSLADLFDAHAVVFLPDQKGHIRPIISHPASFAADASEFAAAQWVSAHNQCAGLGTDTLPEAEALYLPLATPSNVVGVLAIQPEDPNTLQAPGARQLLETCATQIALALARDKLVEESQEARVMMETEKLRSSLLSTVSHDLRTPLAAITGAASSLSESFRSLDVDTRRELLDTMCDESERLTRLVENVLNMTRLSGGRLHVQKQWHPVDEVMGSALNRLQRVLGQRMVETMIPDDPALGHFDDVLVEQVLVNLLENAAKYSPPESPILIQAENAESGVRMTISDAGMGLQAGDEERVFEMFYRGAQAKPETRGTGLGLAICKAIVDAHGGAIGARNRPEGGTVVWFELPTDQEPPRIDLDSPLSVNG